MGTNRSPSIFPFLAPYKAKLIISVLLQIIATIGAIAPFIFVYLIAIALFNANYDRAYIWQLIIASFVAIIARWILLAIAGTFSHIVAYNVLYDIRIKIAEKFGKLSLGYFQNNSTGTLKKVMNEDVEYLEICIAHGIPEGIGLVATFVLTNIYLFTVDWRLALATLAGIPLLFLSQYLMFKDLKPILERYFLSQDRMNATIIEYVRGMAVIKAFTQTAESFAKYQKSVRSYHKLEEEWTKSTLFPWTMFSVSTTANLVVILPVGVWLLNRGSIELPTLILFLILGLGICTPLLNLLESTEVYVKTNKAIERVYSILNEPEIVEGEKTSIPQDLTIEFKDVHFSYQEKEILQGISLTIPPQSITALVGPSGSGKTTIARLISRFWDIDRGKISIGGVNIKEIKLTELMSKIAFVFQDVVLFNDSIYENIRMGNSNVSEEEVIAAAKIARCHDFISQLPSGYQTVIGERGAKLSGGQKQRISIARAILKDAPIVILDEATAFIDPENEAQIQAAISALIENKTLLIIAHRLSTITEADRILVVDSGRIVAKGTHQELLENSSLYSQMWQAHVEAQGWSLDGKEPIFVGSRSEIF